jgi:serine/threonine protein kinase
MDDKESPPHKRQGTLGSSDRIGQRRVEGSEIISSEFVDFFEFADIQQSILSRLIRTNLATISTIDPDKETARMNQDTAPRYREFVEPAVAAFLRDEQRVQSFWETQGEAKTRELLQQILPIKSHRFRLERILGGFAIKLAKKDFESVVVQAVETGDGETMDKKKVSDALSSLDTLGYVVDTDTLPLPVDFPLPKNTGIILVVDDRQSKDVLKRERWELVGQRFDKTLKENAKLRRLQATFTPVDREVSKGLYHLAGEIKEGRFVPFAGLNLSRKWMGEHPDLARLLYSISKRANHLVVNNALSESLLSALIRSGIFHPEKLNALLAQLQDERGGAGFEIPDVSSLYSPDVAVLVPQFEGRFIASKSTLAPGQIIGEKDQFKIERLFKRGGQAQTALGVALDRAGNPTGKPVMVEEFLFKLDEILLTNPQIVAAYVRTLMEMYMRVNQSKAVPFKWLFNQIRDLAGSSDESLVYRSELYNIVKNTWLSRHTEYIEGTVAGQSMVVFDDLELNISMRNSILDGKTLTILRPDLNQEMIDHLVSAVANLAEKSGTTGNMKTLNEELVALKKRRAISHRIRELLNPRVLPKLHAIIHTRPPGQETNPLAPEITYEVEEFIPGQQLDELFAQAQSGKLIWDIDARVEAAVAMIASLADLHKSGVIHRDLKIEHFRFTPDYKSWILTSPDQSVKILDPDMLGIDNLHIAKDVLIHLGLSEPQIPFGTPGYDSPETVEGIISFQQDNYAAGITILWLFGGENPSENPDLSGRDFDKRFATAQRLLSQRAYGKRTVPIEIESIILRAIDPDRLNRWQSSNEMLHALQNYYEFSKRQQSDTEFHHVISDTNPRREPRSYRGDEGVYDYVYPLSSDFHGVSPLTTNERLYKLRQLAIADFADPNRYDYVKYFAFQGMMLLIGRALPSDISVVDVDLVAETAFEVFHNLPPEKSTKHDYLDVVSQVIEILNHPSITNTPEKVMRMVRFGERLFAETLIPTLSKEAVGQFFFNSMTGHLTRDQGTFFQTYHIADGARNRMLNFVESCLGNINKDDWGISMYIKEYLNLLSNPSVLKPNEYLDRMSQFVDRELTDLSTYDSDQIENVAEAAFPFFLVAFKKLTGQPMKHWLSSAEHCLDLAAPENVTGLLRQYSEIFENWYSDEGSLQYYSLMLSRQLTNLTNRNRDAAEKLASYGQNYIGEKILPPHGIMYHPNNEVSAEVLDAYESCIFAIDFKYQRGMYDPKFPDLLPPEVIHYLDLIYSIAHGNRKRTQEMLKRLDDMDKDLRTIRDRGLGQQLVRYIEMYKYSVDHLPPVS